MASTPENRYQSAKDLADDIQRFQSGALVNAYRYHSYDLFARFVDRYRSILVTAAAAIVLLTGLSLVFSLNTLRTNREVARARDGRYCTCR